MNSLSPRPDNVVDFPQAAPVQTTSNRARLPDTRPSLTHHFNIAGHDGYLTIGFFDDGKPGEMFVVMSKDGTTIRGLMDTLGALTSIALQHRVPLEELTRKFAHQRFEPSGYTQNKDLRNAASIVDYVFRYMELTCPHVSIRDGMVQVANAKVAEAKA